MEIKQKNSTNYLKQFYKDIDFAIEEHLPFPAHYKVTPGMIEGGVDGLEVEIITQGKKGIISYRQTVGWKTIENDEKRVLFVNEFLNTFLKKLKKSF